MRGTQWEGAPLGGVTSDDLGQRCPALPVGRQHLGAVQGIQ